MEMKMAIEHAIDGEALLFLGSGFSSSARNTNDLHPRTGRKLAQLLCKMSGLTTSGPLQDASDLYVERFGPISLVDVLTKEYQVITIAPEHTVFGKIPWRRVYTTNYDNTMELAYKANSRTMVPIILTDHIRRVAEASAQCVHINGFIDGLTEDALFSTFKLTDTSYSSSTFAASPWSAQFRHDISAASAVLFVGYSLYDLDVCRILLESPEVANKTIFVAGRNPDELTKSRLAKYGQLAPVDTVDVAKLIDEILHSYTPRVHTSLRGRFVVPIHAPPAGAGPRDRDVHDLFLWGKVDRGLVWSSVSRSFPQPYVCTRAMVGRCLEMLCDGEKHIVVRSDLGNGKTLFLETLGAMAAQSGFNVLYLDAQGSGSVLEVEEASRASAKTLLLIDGYTNKRSEVEALSRNRSDQLHVVYSARSLKHDVCYEWLQRSLEVDTIPELDLDVLDPADSAWFCDVLDTYGLWGARASATTEQKARFLQEKCGAHTSTLLLEILQAPTIIERLSAVIEGISGKDRDYVKTVASILVLSVIEIATTTEVLTDLIGTEVLNQASFRNLESVKELLDFKSGRIIAKSSVVGRYILTESIDPQVTVTALTQMAVRANSLRGKALYHDILRELMRFGNVQSVLPAKHHMNAILVYYEALKNLDSAKRNPHFWLQYAIGNIALSRYEDAGIKLDTAYALAKTLPGYNTYMLDNTAARLELEKLTVTPESDRSVAMAGFRRARGILNEQVSSPYHRDYPFRVAAKYGAFLAVYRSILTPEDKEEIARACRFMLRRIEALPTYRAEQRYVKECYGVMQRIVKEDPIVDV